MTRDEDLLEGCHDDPSGAEAVAAIFTIAWSLLLISFWLLCIPFLLVRWVFRRLRRTTYDDRTTATEEPYVWRKGY